MEMKKLTDNQRRFVIKLLEQGGQHDKAQACALASGYAHPEAGNTLMRNPKVLAALHEEAQKRLVGAALLGVSGLIEIAGDRGHKDRFQALRTLAAINGFTSEQKITVTHISQDQGTVVARIVERARSLGVDPKPLLLQAGLDETILDAEFEEVAVSQGEDW